MLRYADAESVTLVKNILAGQRRSMRISTVTSSRSHAVRIQSMVDDLDGTGMRQIGQFHVARNELPEVIAALNQAKLQLAKLSTPPEPASPRRPIPQRI